MNVFDLMAKLGLDTSGYESGLSAAETLGSKFGTGIKKAAMITGAAVTAASGAVVGFAKSSVDAGMSFDASMSQVAATMGVAVKDIEQLRNFAQQMGSTTAFSATQAADALNYMALAGYDAETSMKMLPNVLDLAAAGGIDLAAASDMVTDAQSALGLTIPQTTDMVDQMAKASSKTNTSVAQLGEAILTIGATAKSVKGGTKELSTVLGVLADNGIKGAEGGTHLRNILLSLTNPTDKAAETLKNLGVEIYDSEGNMRSMIDIVGDLQKATADMSQEAKNTAIGSIFQKADMASVNALLNTQQERYAELTTEIGNAQGAASQMANTQLDNLAGDITLFKSALEGAQIAVSDQLTPSIRNFVQFGSDGLSKLTEAFKEDGLSGAMGAFGTILSDGLGMLTEKTPELVDAGIKLIGAFGKGLIDNVPKVLEAGKEIVLKLAKTMSDNAPLIIPTVVSLLLTIASSLSDPAFLSQLLTAGKNIITGLAKGLVDAAPMIVEQLPVIISNIVDFFVSGIPTLVGAIMQVIEALINPDVLATVVSAALALAQGLTDGLIAAIPIIIEQLPVIIDSICQFLITAMPLLMDAGIQLFDALIQALPVILEALMTALPKVIDSIVQLVINGMPLLLKGAIQLFMALIKALPTIITLLVKNVPEIVTTIITTLLKNLPALIQGAVELFFGILEAIPQIVIELGKQMPTIIKAIVDGLGAGLKSVTEVGSQLIKGLWNGISNMSKWIGDKIKGFGKGVLDGLKNFFGIKSPSRLFRDVIGKNLALGLGEGFEKEMPSTISDMVDSVSGVADDLSDAISFDGIGASMQSAVSAYAVNARGVSDASEEKISKYEFGDIIVNVTGTEGQSIRELAKEVVDEIQNLIDDKEKVYA